MKHIAITQVELNGAEINSVNARDLHKNFGIKTRFADWVKRQLELFIEGEDFLKIEKPTENNTIDYILTIETAKHIAMMQKTDKGMELRKYFIDIENQHNKNLINSLSGQLKNVQALFQTQEVMGEVVTDHDRRISNLEKNRRMESWMEKNLQDAKNRKVYELANGDDKLASKLHRLVWKGFKNKFNLPRYSELTAGRYEDGLMWLNNISLADVV